MVRYHRRDQQFSRNFSHSIIPNNQWNQSMIQMLVVFAFMTCIVALPSGLPSNSLLKRRLDSENSRILGFEFKFCPNIGQLSNMSIYANEILNVTSINADAVLNVTNEASKWGSAAATTIMTLLPTLLTLAPLPTANIRDLMYLSPAAAFWTAGLTLGLNVQSRLLVPPERIIRVDKLVSGGGLINCQRYGLNALSRWYQSTNEDQSLFNLQTRVLERTNSQTIWASLMRTSGYCIAQFIALCASFTFVRLIDVAYIIWTCPGVSSLVFATWLAVAFTVSALIRSFVVSSMHSHQEIFHLTPASTPVGEQLTNGSHRALEASTKTRTPSQRPHGPMLYG